MNWTWDMYSICAVAGGIFFIAQLLFGGHDVDDGDHAEARLFSLRSLLVAATFFGIGGKLAGSVGASPAAILVTAILCGVLAALLTCLLVRFIYRQQASSLLKDRDFIGATGVVHVAIETGGIGEVVVELKGQRKYLPARSADGQAIAVKTPVEIVDNISGYLIVETANL